MTTSRGTIMACRLYLLLLALVIMSVLASARRPPVVENHHVTSEPGPDPIPVVSEPTRPPVNYGSANELRNGEVEIDRDDGNGNGKLKPESTQPDPLPGIGLIPIIPGADGSFHFALGPIDLGGNVGLGGGLAPGYVIPYSQPQPYVVVSPYTSPYVTSPPNAPSQGYYGPVSGYGQPSQGYFGPYSSARGGSPPVQYGQPYQGHYGPYASARGNAPSSGQIGGSVSNQYN